MFYSVDTLHQQLGYLQQFATDSGNGVDDAANVIWAYGLTAAGPTAIVNTYTHTRANPNAPIFANFTSQTPLLPPTTGIRSVSSIAAELETNSAAGARWSFAQITIGNNAALMEQAITLLDKVFLPLQTVTGFQVSVDIQPITRATTGKSALTGGNSLGLHPRKNGELQCKLL